MTKHARSPADAPERSALPLEQLPAVLRPHRKLLRYYALSSLLTGPAFPVVLLVLYFRYHTLRYDVDSEGIAMRWGILFRREVSLTYARIQDIHLTSNAVERWLGLAKIQLQTASGSAGAEMTVEGIEYYELMRDFLYARMRGTRDHTPVTGARGPATPSVAGADELTTTLREIAAELRALRLDVLERESRGV